MLTSKDEELEIVQQEEHESEEEGNICIICQSMWSTNGEHRAVACKCGHMFGKTCILRWIQEKHSCPICKARLNTNDIIPLFFEGSTSKLYKNELRKELAKENNELRKKMRKERKMRKYVENCIFQIKQKIDQQIEECNKNEPVNSDNISKPVEVGIKKVEKNGEEKTASKLKTGTVSIDFLKKLQKQIASFDIEKPFGARAQSIVSNKNMIEIASPNRMQRKRPRIDRPPESLSNEDSTSDLEINIEDITTPKFIESKTIEMREECKFFEFIDPGTIISDKGGSLLLYSMLRDLPIAEFQVITSNPGCNINQMVYDNARKRIICTNQNKELIIADPQEKRITNIRKLNYVPTCVCTYGSSSPYFAIGSDHGQVAIYDIRKNGNEAISSFIVHTPQDKIESICYVKLPNERNLDCLLAAKGKTNSNTFFCKSTNSYDWEVSSLLLEKPQNASLNYHVQQDPISNLCVSSFTSPAASTDRSITHTLFRLHRNSSSHFSSDGIMHVNQRTEPLPGELQPTYFQRLGITHLVDYYPSPTQLFTVRYTPSDSTSQPTYNLIDDEVISIDNNQFAEKTLLAYTQFTKVTLADALTGTVFQQLPSRHRNIIECVKTLDHPLGNFLGQMSKDRFTLFRLDS
jgi:hypothetical protein